MYHEIKNPIHSIIYVGEFQRRLKEKANDSVAKNRDNSVWEHVPIRTSEGMPAISIARSR